MDLTTQSKPPPTASEDGDALPVSSFQSLSAEADILFKQGDLGKAIEAFSKALELRPGDKATLVARSRCFLQMGDSARALEDAEESLKDQPDFFKGIYHKAEALYAQGDFELALVYFHRGNRLRPESADFRLGIQKAREAINNAIGKPDVQRPFDSSHRDPSPGTGSKHRDSAAWVINYEHGTRQGLLSPDVVAKAGLRIGPASSAGPKRGGNDMMASSRPLSGSSSAARSVGGDTQTARYDAKPGRLLLGELSEDREYLDALLNDKDFVQHPNPEITTLVRQGIQYLDQRLEFWRQERPLYARTDQDQRREASRLRKRNAENIKKSEFEAKQREQQKEHAGTAQKMKLGLTPKRSDAHGTAKAPPLPVTLQLTPPKKRSLKSALSQPTSHQKFISTTTQAISDALLNENYAPALAMCETFLAKIADLCEVKEKEVLVCDVYEDAAEALVGLGHFADAVVYLENELTLATTHKLPTATSRALGSLGRTHVRLHNYTHAIEYWTQKLGQTPRGHDERLWLLHDLARCYFETGQMHKCVEMASMCLDEGRDAPKGVEGTGAWMLNAGVVRAKAYARLGDTLSAHVSYNEAHTIAKEIGDTAAVASISGEMRSLEQSASSGLKVDPKGSVAGGLVATHSDDQSAVGILQPIGQRASFVGGVKEQ
ncbi:TPR-like protein [Gonapodya prolifera JEL478]|uniref:Outer dynein arm-docking complex subunit 4 n=1 Tax=Gonapodya prolifera (strain JEL478) TaxID=1344416 RepID=A0A139A4B1_GONPJ|nr:TPR-like protein [Gonapodya prolifera JEL478]|eukprot:KXS11428.1 TPR-like protein [Gonapodya prolifera JEL478]